MKHGLVTMLTVALACSVSASFAEEREPLERKRRMAPIRGRQLSPARAEQQRERDEAAEWKREQEEWHDRHDRKGGGDKEDDDE